MSRSDGSTADYYVLPEGATQLQDLISHRNMNAQIGEITRACYRYGMASHSDMLRDAKKIRFYAQAEVERLEKLEFDATTMPIIDLKAKDMSEWQNWKRGDIVESMESGGGITNGDSYILIADPEQESGDIRFYDDEGCARIRDADKYRFVSRP